MTARGVKASFQTDLTDTSTVDKEGIGELRFDGPNVYKWCRYNQGAGAIAAATGNVVGYYLNTGYASSIVSSDVSDCIGAAGVLMSAPANNSYCWIQIEGPATLTTALVSGADGNALTLSTTTDGTLKVAGAVTDQVCAFARVAASKSVICAFPH